VITHPWLQSNMTDLAGQSPAQKATPPDSSSNAVTTTYNANGDTSVVTNPNGNTAASTYDGSGRVTGISYGDGITPPVSYTCNSDGTVASMTDGSGTTSYAYDAQGNRTCQGTASPCSSNTTYTYGYDANNRLTSWADTTNDSETFSYDGNGLLQQTLYKTPGSVCPSIPQGGSSATPWTPVPSISNRPRKDSSPGYCTDETNLVWNTALGTPTLAVDQQYATGVDEGHTDYLMGPQGLPVEQLAVAAGGGKGSGTPLYYYQDLQGNTGALEDGTGAVVNVQNYPPYGVATGSFGNTGWTPLQYNGTYTDGTTGFVYDQARWYDPSTGQFISQDPLVDQTLQPYAYAQGSPVNVSDPTGLRPQPVRFGGKDAIRQAYKWFKRNGRLATRKGRREVTEKEFGKAVEEIKHARGLRPDNHEIEIHGDRYGTVTWRPPGSKDLEEIGRLTDEGVVIEAGFVAAAIVVGGYVVAWAILGGRRACGYEAPCLT